MKRLCAIAMLAIAGLGAASSRAHALGALASWWNMNDTDSDGFGVGVRHRIKLAAIVSLDMRASYLHFSDGFVHQKVQITSADPPGTVRSDLNVYPLEAAGLVSLGVFYAGAGIGYYILDSDGAELDNNAGWFVAGGAEVGVGSVTIFGELKWTQVEADYHTAGPQYGTDGTIKADGAGVMVGVTFGI